MPKFIKNIIKGQSNYYNMSGLKKIQDYEEKNWLPSIRVGAFCFYLIIRKLRR
jgi:hypothetical protein